MSEQKQAHVAASVDNGMVVGAGHSRRYYTHLKLWLVGACVVLVLAVVGWCVYEIWRDHTKAVGTSVYSPHFSTLAAAEQDATNSINSGDFSRALADLQSATSLATTKQQQSDLYLRLANAAQNTSNTQLAIQYYQKRHAVDPSTIGPDAYTLGGLYQQVDEKEQAIVQYQTYISYFQAHSKAVPPYTPDTVIAPIQAQIQALEDNK